MAKLREQSPEPLGDSERLTLGEIAARYGDPDLLDGTEQGWSAYAAGACRAASAHRLSRGTP